MQVSIHWNSDTMHTVSAHILYPKVDGVQLTTEN